MLRYIILSPDAEADIQSASRWYYTKEKSLFFRFRTETRLTLNRIARYPLQFPLVHKSIRRAVMRRFPYRIYFTVSEYSVLV